MDINVFTMQNSELKELITRAGLSHSDCIERSELCNRALEAIARSNVAPHSSTPQGEWACATCTFLNKDEHTRCTMCRQGLRPEINTIQGAPLSLIIITHLDRMRHRQGLEEDLDVQDVAIPLDMMLAAITGVNLDSNALRQLFPDMQIPTSTEIVSELPMRKYEGEGAAPQSCVICMETFEQGALLTTLPCFHQFHNTCVECWLQRADTCPICKYRLV